MHFIIIMKYQVRRSRTEACLEEEEKEEEKNKKERKKERKKRKKERKKEEERRWMEVGWRE